MSLNGLDDPKIKEAHTAAVAEPGGWFLLKYISRDEVDLLGRGNGGIVEIRNAIANYEEPSPLFGFLRYRRRNVVIKYVPEECSRLVQARVTVHFNAVTEYFSPHDTVFPITTSKELRDTTLSAACSLHTASGSTSSSTSSLRRRRLMEIAEEEEEEIRAKRQSTVPEERPSTAKRHSISGSQPVLTDEPALPTNLPPPSHQSLSTDSASLSPPREQRSSDSEAWSPTRSIGEPRRSTQSTRPEYSSYGSSGRPKVKLGPRPSLDVGGRPNTSASSSLYRPVSTLPAGLKLFSKGSKKEKNRPQSQYISDPPNIPIPPPPEPATSMSELTPTRPHTSGGRPTTSSGVSIRPMLSPALSMAPRLPGMTPERARLMKAQELRRKKIAAAKAAEEESAKAAVEDESTKREEETEMPINVPLPEPVEAPRDLQPTLAMLNDMAKSEDSGIAFDARSTLKSDESDATRSDSYPVSPAGASERAESTTASSVSESTDETIQERKNISPLLYNDSTAANTPTERENAKLHSMDPELPTLLPVTYSPVKTTPMADEPQTTTDLSAKKSNGAKEQELKTQEPLTEAPAAKPIVQAADDQMAIPTTSIVDVDFVGSSSSAPADTEQAQTHPNLENIPQLQLPTKAGAKEWNIPRSKFSVQNLKEASSSHKIPTEPLPLNSDRSELNLPQKSPVDSTFSIDTKHSNFEDGTESGASSFKKSKRKGPIDPIRTDLDSADRSGANSDDNFSSDDDLMDELQSAVFQEAKPISVSKSPVSPVFPMPSPSKARGGEMRLSRAVTTPMRNRSPDSQLLELPSSSHSDSARSTSASAAYLNRVNSQPAKPMAKKTNLGSGISQRIKALEKLSSLSPDQNTSLGTTAGTPTFFSVRKPSVRGAAKSSYIAERANSLTANTPSPSISRESTPEHGKGRDRSPSIQNRVDAFKSNTNASNQVSRSRPESVSVTARIVRDPSQPFQPRSDAGKDPLDYAPLDLKQSPLVIDHQRAVEVPKETILERRLSKERPTSLTSNTTKKERRSSMTIIKDLISDRRSSISEHRKSLTLERPVPSPQVLSPSRPPSTHVTKGHQRQMSITSRRSSSSRGETGNVLSPSPSSTSLSDDKSDKKSNRASRMLHRMSSALSPGRKVAAQTFSPPLREELEHSFDNGVESNSSTLPSNTPTSIGISDVNVQFPDTLLWKRRTMFLDSQGYLIMAPALTAHANAKEKTSAGTTRRFHLSEFRALSIPDVEVQELPNSVVLDFLEGGELQVACEDKAGQAEILSILQEAHRNWTGQ